MVNVRSLLFLITTIVIISGGELKISANNYILPTKALFDYVDENGEAHIGLSDYPVRITFDRQPTCEVVVMYTYTELYPVKFYTEKLPVDNMVLTLPSNFHEYGGILNNKYNVTVTVGFIDEYENPVTDEYGNPVSFSQIYIIDPTEYAETTVVRYSFELSDGLPNGQNRKLASQNARMSSAAAIFHFNPEFENLPAEIRKSMEFACSIWAPLLPAGTNILLKISYGDYDVPLNANVQYKGTLDSSLQVPISLYENIRIMNANLDGSLVENFNGDQKNAVEIEVSSSVNWDTNVCDNINSNQPNLPTALTTIIGRALGIGSSITMDNNEYGIANKLGYYTIFDDLIHRSDGQKITQFNMRRGRDKTKLQAFVEDPDYHFYICKDTDNFRLASGPFSISNPPLTKFANGFMSSQLVPGEYFLNLDDEVFETLQAIGWKTPSFSNLIHCPDIADNGIGSLYQNYTFLCNYAGPTPSAYYWVCEVPLKDGSYFPVATSESAQFQVPALGENDKFRLSADGTIDCQINLTLEFDGLYVKVAPYTLHLNHKPTVLGAYIKKINIDYTHNIYDLEFNVEYRGSDLIEVCLYRKNNPTIRTWDIREPYATSGIIPSISFSAEPWVQFKVSNSLGSHTYRVDVPRGEIAMLNSESELIEISGREDVAYYIAYDLWGNKVWQGDERIDFIESEMKGLFILTRYMEDGTAYTEKIINK